MSSRPRCPYLYVGEGVRECRLGLTDCEECEAEQDHADELIADMAREG